MAARFAAISPPPSTANGRLPTDEAGYAGGTIALSLIPRYHALLVAPVEPLLGRVLTIHSLLIRDATGLP